MGPSTANDDGFGLTEVMVAMLLLLIIMVAMTSAVIIALTTTASNNTVASAAEAAQQRVEDVRAASVAGDCDVIEAAAAGTGGPVYDGRGVEILISTTLVKKGTTSDACTRTATSGERDPVQVMTLTVRALPDLPGAVEPVAVVTTDILVKFQP